MKLLLFLSIVFSSCFIHAYYYTPPKPAKPFIIGNPNSLMNRMMKDNYESEMDSYNDSMERKMRDQQLRIEELESERESRNNSLFNSNVFNYGF